MVEVKSIMTVTQTILTKTEEKETEIMVEIIEIKWKVIRDFVMVDKELTARTQLMKSIRKILASIIITMALEIIMTDIGLI